MAHAHQRLIDRVEDDLADPRVLDQHPLLAGLDVHRHQVPEREEARLSLVKKAVPLVGS